MASATAKRGDIMANIEGRGEYTEKNVKELIAKVKFFEEKDAAAKAAGTELKPDMASKFEKVVALSKKAVGTLEGRNDVKSRTLLGKFGGLTSLRGVAATPVAAVKKNVAPAPAPAPAPAAPAPSIVAKPPVQGILKKKEAAAFASTPKAATFTPAMTAIEELEGENWNSQNGNSPLPSQNLNGNSSTMNGSVLGNNNSGYNSNAVLANVSSRYLAKHPLPELYDPYTGRKFSPEESPMTPIQKAYEELKAIRAKVKKAVSSRKLALKKKAAAKGKTRVYSI
jgi:hypothetical protein